MKVIVCGGRDYCDSNNLNNILNLIHKETPIDTIIHGDARGADKLAGLWANANGIEEVPFAADWVKHGKSAGPIRNREMLLQTKPDLIVAFPGGRGTQDMITVSRKHGYKVIEILT